MARQSLSVLFAFIAITFLALLAWTAPQAYCAPLPVGTDRVPKNGDDASNINKNNGVSPKDVADDPYAAYADDYGDLYAYDVYAEETLLYVFFRCI